MPGLLTSAPLLQTEIQERLDGLICDLQTCGRQQVDYPTNQAFDYSSLLPFLDYAINNFGDPFHPSNYLSNIHTIERDVVARFAGLMRINPADAWGYVTSGGTEGNMYGLYLARELSPSLCSTSPKRPTTAYSRTCAYSTPAAL